MESYSIKALSFKYPGRDEKALDELTLDIPLGQFVAICGYSGCGKTTLLRQLKPSLAPHGEMTGELLFEGVPLRELDARAQCAKIGFVLQSPENQIVTDKVWHELAFGLESLGTDSETIRLRVAEMASFFGIETWFHKSVSELSGGQKQLLNLASVMVMQPSVLILDEPTSQLDPIAAGEFLSTIGRINRELGVTVIITEHRLEEVFPICERVLVMDGGRILCDGTPKQVGALLKEKKHGMFMSMPVPMRVYAGVQGELDCPVTIREGRQWLADYSAVHALHDVPVQPPIVPDKNELPVLELEGIWFRYEKNAPDVVKGLSLKVRKGELFAIVGGNGTGKTTSLSLMSGLNKPYRGKVRINGTELSKIKSENLYGGLLGVLPQNPQALFVKNTVLEDLEEMLEDMGLDKSEARQKILDAVRLCKLQGLLNRHPFDLSGGEQQRAALAKVLLSQPQILLLDEPTKGMDSSFKQVFANILRDLTDKGVTVVMVSHDIEFCASTAHRCALFFDGDAVSCDIPQRFFSGNTFYTTAANRMSRELLPLAVTAQDIITACGGQEVIYQPPSPSGGTDDYNGWDGGESAGKSKKPVGGGMTKPRAAGIIMSASALIITLIYAVINLDSELFISILQNDTLISAETMIVSAVVLALVLELIALVSFIRNKPKEKRIRAEQTIQGDRRLTGRTLAALGMIVVAIPLTIYAGVYFLGDRKFMFISLMIILETMLPFFLLFEKRKPQARELVIIAVLCALGVAGRTAFFMLPQVKPVIAIVVISAVAFGGETGFLVGAVTAFVSNMFMGQGPWTPWQMYAFGIIGFLAGVLHRIGILDRGRAVLCTFGGLSALIIYGGIMNPASVLMFQPDPTWEMIALSYLQGIPFDIIHAAATVVFLWLIAGPMLEKLDRVKIKYGLIK
ncbi:MAG: ATP-binding cassette domain-containing protein [Eubacteriales bacterium]